MERGGLERRHGVVIVTKTSLTVVAVIPEEGGALVLSGSEESRHPPGAMEMIEGQRHAQ